MNESRIQARVPRALVLAAATCVAAAFVAATALPAQSLGDRLKQKAKERVDARVERTLDRAVDRAEGVVNCLVGDEECATKAKAAGKKVKTHESEEELEAANAAAAQASAKTAAAKEPASSETTAPPAIDTRSWENFDFVPGERVLFADDFSRDRVGNFPQRLQLIEGNAQIVESRGARWLQGSSRPTVVQINLPEELPRRFTVEFDMTLSGGFPLKVGIASQGEGDPDFESAQTRAFIGAFGAGLAGGGVKATSVVMIDGKSREAVAGTQVRVRMQADGDYMKLYVNEHRVANVPSAKFGRARQLVIQSWGEDDSPSLVGNLTVAAGGRGLYDALLENGRVATQGIFFDTGSDRIRPESAPTLKQIGDMLKEHGDLKLLIEGHTDNVGNAASNLTLSDKRAAAVKVWLTGNFGVDASRLQTRGYGDTKPSAPNTTPEGKQQNRRVELVKI